MNLLHSPINTFNQIKGKANHIAYLTMWLVFLALGSCSNDIKEVQMINADKGTPDESMAGVTMLYTDNGMRKAILKTPIIYKYGEDQGRTEFPKGLSVDFFDANGEKESYLRSDEGILNDKGHFLELKRNVVMINYKRKDTLLTNYLIWKQDSGLIVSPDTVRIYGETGRFRGDHFRGRENFTKYTWNNFKGDYFYNQTDTL